MLLSYFTGEFVNLSVSQEESTLTGHILSPYFSQMKWKELEECTAYIRVQNVLMTALLQHWSG